MVLEKNAKNNMDAKNKERWCFFKGRKKKDYF